MIACISSNIPFGWCYEIKSGRIKLEGTFKKRKKMGIALFVQYTVLLCGHIIISLSICSVSLFPHTVWLCEVVGKELTVSCQQWRHQKVVFGRIWGASAHRIAAGITQSGMLLLLQGWFRTIMEKLCGGFSANHPDACTHVHTYTHIIRTSLAHIH